MALIEKLSAPQIHPRSARALEVYPGVLVNQKQLSECTLTDRLRLFLASR
jgi:hypothetical protein